MVDVETSAAGKKRRNGTRVPKWRSLKDVCLCDTWKDVSLDPITGAQQTFGKYYKRIFDKFNERKHFREYVAMHMILNQSAMSHRCYIVQAACKKIHGYLEQIHGRTRAARL